MGPEEAWPASKGIGHPADVLGDMKIYVKARNFARNSGQLKVLAWLSNNVDVVKWLEFKGFEPEGNLAEQRCGFDWTAMFRAAEAGEIGIMKWLCSNGGAASTLQTPNR